ncbi:hypothetical protein DFH11DRAFT_147026 [Phellopilus nigrolimitatus]|nr:hypothetical protein DFH11DRAFT_147026 [Phellopilus nigrolimitatus]
MRLSSKYFKPIHQMLVEVEQTEAAKPRTLDNEFSSVERDPEGKFIIFNERFNNRVRPSDRTEIAMFDEAGIEYRGRATSANGKQTRVVPLENTDLRTFKGIRVLGKEELNQAERARDGFLLEVLQGKRALDDPAYGLIPHLFFPGPNPTPTEKVTGARGLGRLNQSQADVVEAMVGSEAPFVIVHGPPGTGKTSTISVAAQEWIDIGSSVWVVAQSNIGVKNIAEKLCKDNVKFRILVSKEFYFEWNEHIYEDQVKESLIRTDELPATSQEMSIAFHEVRVVLCTLSTISNPNLNRKGVFNFVPMENLVVDEASQIGIFNYMVSALYLSAHRTGNLLQMFSFSMSLRSPSVCTRSASLAIQSNYLPMVRMSLRRYNVYLMSSISNRKRTSSTRNTACPYLSERSSPAKFTIASSCLSII